MTDWTCPGHWPVGPITEEWERIVARLRDQKLLDQTEPKAVEAYCDSYYQFREAQDFIFENGQHAELRNEKGELKGVIKVPQVGILEKAKQQMNDFLRDCGLTPGSWGKVDREQGGRIDDEDPRDALRSRLLRIAKGT